MTNVRGPLEKTCKDGNSGLRLGIFSEHILRRPISRGSWQISKREDMVLVIRVSTFAVLTTLYGDLEIYTCMTLWMESSPYVSKKHMFKERKFLSFLCINSWPMLMCIMCRCTNRVLGDFVRLYETWLPSLIMLNVQLRSKRERNSGL